MIVTQHRQAVNVRDPVKLAGFLELLIGTAGYQEQVETLRTRVRETCGEQDAADDEVSRCDIVEGFRHTAALTIDIALEGKHMPTGWHSTGWRALQVCRARRRCHSIWL